MLNRLSQPVHTRCILRWQLSEVGQRQLVMSPEVCEVQTLDSGEL